MQCSDRKKTNNEERLATPKSYDKVPEAICKHSAAAAFDYQFVFCRCCCCANSELQIDGTSTRKKWHCRRFHLISISYRCAAIQKKKFQVNAINFFNIQFFLFCFLLSAQSSFIIFFVQ